MQHILYFESFAPHRRWGCRATPAPGHADFNRSPRRRVVSLRAGCPILGDGLNAIGRSNLPLSLPFLFGAPHG